MYERFAGLGSGFSFEIRRAHTIDNMNHPGATLDLSALKCLSFANQGMKGERLPAIQNFARLSMFID